MKPFALTHKAKVDLHSIAVFTTERWGVKQRNLYIKQLDEAFHMLARSPELGKSCDDILPGYRKFPQGSHIVFYKDGINSKIEVIRILHKSMDVDTQILGAERLI
jgi:toxin ParE1/3/4